MRALGGGSGEDEKLQQAQAELETAGAGGRKKMRMTTTKTNIREAEWEGTEWHGFADDVMRDVQDAIDENEGTKGSKRRNNDKIVTPRKPLRQTAMNGQKESTTLEDVLDDEVTIAKRPKKAMRKSGASRMSLLHARDNTISTPKSKASPKTADDVTLRHASSTTITSPSKTSPNKRILMRSKSTVQRRTSTSEPRRLSGALFADASPITISTPPNVNIDFNAPTANAIRFGATKSAMGTPVRAAFGTPVRGQPVSAFAMHNAPRTAPAKIQPTRSEIEQEMASFFTPIPRLKKSKRRSSPIKSYLQQLLENREDSAVTASQEAQDAAEARDVVMPEMDAAESPLAFARDLPPASPNILVEEPVEDSVQASSPRVDDEPAVELHASLNAVAPVVPAAVRLDFESVPDLSIDKLGSFADESTLSQDESMVEEAVVGWDNSNAQDDDEEEEEDEEDFDPADQLIAEFAASQEEEASSSGSDTVADDEVAVIDDEDDLMLDAPPPTIAESEIAASAPAFESSISIDIAVESGSDSNDEAVSDNSVSTDESAADNVTNVSTSFDDEETAMLLAFVTKNQAKKLARTSPKSKTPHAPHSPLRLPLSEVAGNEEEVTKKVLGIEKLASPTKKSRRLNPGTAIDIPSDLPASEMPEPSSAVRRSSRSVVTKQSKIPAPPSFIPVRGLSGVDAHEAKAPKKEKSVEQITKLNTGKNKAGCLQPMVVLKRLKMEEKMSNSAKQLGIKDTLKESPKKKADGGKEKKKLVWAEELTAVREFDEKSIVRPVEKPDKKKEKAAGVKLEETKKTRVRVGTASERASKAALGMVANGTPAKRKSKEVVDVKEDKKMKPAAKKVRQPKLRSPKVKVKKADEDVVMG